MSLDEKRDAEYNSDIQDYSSVVIGPGMGTGERAKKLLADFIDFYRGPLVIDADGITILADPALKAKLH